MVITLLLLERFLPERTALVAAVTTLLATNLTWFVGPITSHVVAFFSTALFLLLTLRLQDDNSSLRRWAATGAAAGLMLLCRPQNGTFLVLPLLLAPRLFRRDDLLGSLQGLLVAAVCALFAFSFQFAYWWAYYEQVLHVPKSGYLQWHAVFANYPKVFVGHNGMFKTHPLTVLATIGLLLFAARRFSLGAALVIAFLLHTMASAAAPDWWGAHPESPIGNRRFDGCLPLFALGFGAILEQTLRNRRVFLPTTILFIAFGIAEQCWYWTRP
jgi:4-amino-4-deoxy-L-arabinose transferase-like glycosyltransferase